MKVARRAWLRALAIGALAAVAPVRAQDPRASVVVNAARDWLALVDRGDIAASYARAGAKFRTAVSDKEWVALHERERRPRGVLTRRALFQTRFDTRAPGVASEGEYAALVFRTSFANQVDARETVTLEQEGDGAWRVVGYFIR